MHKIIQKAVTDIRAVKELSVSTVTFCSPLRISLVDSKCEKYKKVSSMSGYADGGCQDNVTVGYVKYTIYMLF